ncbi:MAG: cystathionine beta-lyase MetC, partial [Pseudomonadota bacterium]
MSDATNLIHLGVDSERYGGIVNTPVYRASTVLFPNTGAMAERYEALSRGEDGVMTYARKGTPASFALCDTLSRLEGGYRARLFPSGAAACAAGILAYVGAGDHVLITDSAYAPTRHLVQEVLPRYGISADFYDPLLGQDISKLFKANTRLVYCESPGSHSFELQDIPAIAAVAHSHGALVACDNTWATGLYFKSFTKGVDISIHSATKYITGHSDVSMGVVIANETAWPALYDYATHLGQTSGGDDVYLAQRGLKTMATRMQAQARHSMQIAEWLLSQKQVSAVIHPAHPSHPQHPLWQRDFTGSAGLFAFAF